MDFDILNLPLEILSYIISFLDNDKFNKLIIYSNKRHNFIKKIKYVPSKFTLVSKLWFKAITNIKCKMCCTGVYDLKKNKCINCCHVLENRYIKLNRLNKRLKN